VGSYISTQIYDFSRNILLIKYSFGSYFLFNLLIWLIFGIILSIFVVNVSLNNKEIKELKKSQEKWATTKAINFGRGISPEELEDLNSKMNKLIQDEIIKQMNQKSFTIGQMVRRTNLSREIIKRNLFTLYAAGKIKPKRILFVVKWKLN
jgi:hypothetical protein